MNDRRICKLCGKACFGLMDFAHHVAHKHGISAIEYWDELGFEEDSEKERERKSKKRLNPSRRIQNAC